MSEVWTKNYAPKTLDDVVFPSADIKSEFFDYVNRKELPNILLYGPPGTGKTTLAHLLPELVGADEFFTEKLNGRLNNSIDDVTLLSRKFSLIWAEHTEFGKNVIVWDEVDLLSDRAIKSLKALIDKLQSRCVFIFTTNHLDKLLEKDEAFVNRCNAYDFNYHDVAQLRIRAEAILGFENKYVNPKRLDDIIENTKPSLRKMLRNLELSAT